MSEVLQRFVDPYGDFSDIEDDFSYHDLLTLGVAAWNIALAPEEKQQAMLEKAVHAKKPWRERIFQGFLGELNEPELGQSGLTARDILKQLIERKHESFAKYDREIFDFALQDRGDHYYLNVVSVISRL